MAPDKALPRMTWTPFALLWPRRYIDTDYPWEQFCLSSWNYDWREDDWDGLLDTLKPPAETVQDGRGDCEDYAFVAASALHAASEIEEVTLLVAGEKRRLPSHVAVEAVGLDGREVVYSSGKITYDPAEKWLARSQYDWIWRRPI